MGKGSYMLSSALRRFSGFAALLCALPVLIVIGAAITACGRRPIFTQERIGLNGARFSIWKLRTMDELCSDRTRWQWQNTTLNVVSRAIRRYRLDELPQLGNVALGHMAFVGPRPLLAVDLQNMGPKAANRLVVMPGITGLAQLSGGSALSQEIKLRIDFAYIEARSWSLNLKILIFTVPAVLRGIDRSELLVDGFLRVSRDWPESADVSWIVGTDPLRSDL
jgi:lipopolysaccharide/colanic/teichoic acid biosynthesis glycosyltransferase